jgi:hypothetical protein
VGTVTAKWGAEDVVLIAWMRPREVLKGPSLVDNRSLAIRLSWVAEMVPFQALDVVVLEAAPERNDP